MPTVRAQGVSDEALIDAVHVAALFNMIVRLAPTQAGTFRRSTSSKLAQTRCSPAATRSRKPTSDRDGGARAGGGHARRGRIVLTPRERERIEIADFGLGGLEELGLQSSST
jgi:hypothetical protein